MPFHHISSIFHTKSKTNALFNFILHIYLLPFISVAFQMIALFLSDCHFGEYTTCC